MKVFRFIFFLLLTGGLIYALNTKFGDIPPLGKFLDPANGFWQNAQTVESSLPNSLNLPGLHDEVIIKFDNRLVPHIFAANEHDLYYVQGYITATHRLWQLDLQTRVADGRLAEIVGERGIKMDRYHRRLGMSWAAERSEELLKQNKQAWKIATAYADGVNDYIATLSYRDLPIEYKLLNYEPESYSPYRAILLQKYMANMLTGATNDIEHTNVLKALGPEMFNRLWPQYPEDNSPIVPGNFLEDKQAKNSETDSSSIGFLPEKFIRYDHSFLPDEMNGSNNWAVAAEKTKDGAPILCNDPHLGLNIPSIWYETQLHLPDLNVYGVTLPGAPGIVIGFNEKVAWGVTNAGRDVKDFFTIQFKDKSRNEYRYADSWKKTSKRIEDIKIAGGETYFDTVVYTHWGPVMYDRTFNNNGSVPNLAMKWEAHEPSEDMMTFYYLNRASNYNDYLEAVEYFRCPGQNFCFISKEGDIAIKQQGKFPAHTTLSGRFIRDGSNPESEWPAPIPNDQNPLMHNPERGFVSSANQHPTDSTYPFSYHPGGYFEHYRNRRINQRLSEMENVTVDDMMELQKDNFNLTAYEALPVMLKAFDSEALEGDASEWFKILDNWNRFNDPKEKGPVLFEIWWKTLKPMIWDELNREDGNFVYPNDYQTIRFMSKSSTHPLIDFKETEEKESLTNLLNNSYAHALEKLKKWESEEHGEIIWSNYKGTRLLHLARLPAFSVHNIPIGGNKHIVNACSKTHGPSWRVVVKHGEELEAWGIYPGGQLGNPGSPYYNQFTDKWAAGEYYKLLFLQDAGHHHDEIIFTQKVTSQTKEN